MARLFFLLFALAFVSCASFDPAPGVTLEGEEHGAMTVAPDRPLVVRFSEPVVARTLRVRIVSLAVPNAIDFEGNLLDEQHPPDREAFQASTVLAYDGAAPDDPERTYGAAFALGADRATLTIDPDLSLSVTVPYLLLIEPGLSDEAGNVTVPRIRIPFIYPLEGGGKTRLATGYYYYLINVEFLAQQLRLYTHMRVDPDTGEWHAVMTNAGRRAAGNGRPGCPASCPASTPLCQLLNPELPSCVKPSDKQNKLTEFPDFVPDPTPPTGFKFEVTGFARDEADGSIAFGTAPFDMTITIGTGAVEVTTVGTVLAGKFVDSPTEPGRLIATGTLSVDAVKVNGTGTDPTKGSLQVMSLTPEEVADVAALGAPIPTE
ncbi:MAG: hypothetical protein OZ921_19480 [Sorangiineae bacterium]|nr:hypothetical protein [Polyangiaceae bacterium]MEB2324706.1 hypothetical protein [Sorangiineae bacterium]